MARLVDVERRTLLLDRVVAHLAQDGLANVSLRPMAAALGISVNSLVHHFGSKDDLIIAALRRSGSVQQAIENRWLARQPDMTQADLLRSWWRWINASPQNLAVVRLGIEAAAMEATLRGLPKQVRNEQIRSEQVGLWQTNIETRLIDEGVPRNMAVTEASLVKAMFTGLVIDLLATGQKARLTRALDAGLDRLEEVTRAHSESTEPAFVAANPSERSA